MREYKEIYSLEGRVLKSGWKVIRKIEPRDNRQKGKFSVCYMVEKDGQQRFMKVLDINEHIQRLGPDDDPADAFKQVLDQYTYERDVCNYCKDKHLTNVTVVLYAGNESLDDQTFVPMYYLIFEKADGDVIDAMSDSVKLDFAWRLRSLHSVAVGLQQLHNVGITHEDIKPSNILTFNKKETTKVGDLGCSTCDTIRSPFEDDPFPGDHNYAPIEREYGYHVADLKLSKKLTDCYLLASLITYYITGVSLNALIMPLMPESHRPENYNGVFKDLKNHLDYAFSRALDTIRKDIPFEELEDLIIGIIRQLGNPDPESRCRENEDQLQSTRAQIEKAITSLDYASTLAERLIRKKLTNGFKL